MAASVAVVWTDTVTHPLRPGNRPDGRCGMLLGALRATRRGRESATESGLAQSLNNPLHKIIAGIGRMQFRLTIPEAVMRVVTSIERGAQYLCVKFGDVVTAIQQVAVVKGLPMWEVERQLGGGTRRRLIVPARSLMPLQPSPAGA